MATEPETHTLGGFRSQVKPTFMVPAVGMSVFGGLLSPTVSGSSAAVHALAVGAALYTAHVVDEYVDAHVRGEELPVLSPRATRLAFLASSSVCLSFSAVLVVEGHGAAAASVVALWVLALLHAPVLDRNTLGVTLDYPVGIALALVGGYLTQQPSLVPGVVAIAAVFVVTLAGVKVSIDRLDRQFDERIDKRTIPVVFGERRATKVSAALFLVAAGFVFALVSVSILPRLALASGPFLLAGAGVAVGSAPKRVVTRQMGLVYPVAVTLFLAHCLATGCSLEPFISWVL